MPSSPGDFLSKDYGDEIDKLILERRRNPPNINKGRPPPDSNRPPIRAILLQDLPDGGSADAAVTNQQLSNEIQQIEIVGDAVSGGTFTLTFRGQTTTPLNFNCSNLDMQKALQALPSIGANNALVSLGKQSYANSDSATTATEFPGVWLVQFTGALAGQLTLPLITAQNSLQGGPAIVVDYTTHWIDTGTIETVNAIIPVGTPTPMKAGAVVAAIWYPGIGFGVIACECRQYSVTYY